MQITQGTVEIRVKGKWAKVPSIEFNGMTLFAKGKLPRIAVIRGEDMMECELKKPEQYVNLLTSGNTGSVHADIFTFTQRLPGSQPQFSYPMEWESVAAIQTQSFGNWWENLPQETRKNVRRSQKRGVSIRISEFNDKLIQDIREVNDDSPLRQGLPNAYFGKSLDETRKLYGEFEGRCDFICAYVESELVGFLHLIYRGAVASILNLTTKPSHFDKRPANALIAKAVEVCESKQIRFLTYGLYNYGNKRDNPLREFKVRNGFSEFLTPRYFVPLTYRGKLCMQLDLHKGLVGILPHSVITTGVAVRALWYNARLFLSRCSSMIERPNRNRQMERSNPPAGSTS